MCARSDAARLIRTEAETLKQALIASPALAIDTTLIDDSHLDHCDGPACVAVGRPLRQALRLEPVPPELLALVANLK